MPRRAINEAGLLDLARQAGIEVQWTDAGGVGREVCADTIRAVLRALDLPCGSPAQTRESMVRLSAEQSKYSSDIIIATVNTPIAIKHEGNGDTAYRLTLDTGKQITGHAPATAGHVRIPGIALPGYHCLDFGDRHVTLAVAPDRCPAVQEIAGTKALRRWGLSAQIYSLRTARPERSAQCAGAGGFSALAGLAQAAGKQGATALEISPVHAMFSADPSRYSPYAPSSRLFLNTLYADPALCLGKSRVLSAIGELGLADEAARLESLALINWPSVATFRMKLFRHLYENFRRDIASTEYRSFKNFRRVRGDALEQHGQFEALHARYFTERNGATGWRDWPIEVQSPCGPAVKTYAQSHETEVTFHVFLQWMASCGMQYAQQSAKDAGMAIGLIADLAVGTDPGGSHAWTRQKDMLAQLSVGAPPDIYNPAGQNWGLDTFSPVALQASGYRAFIEMLQAVLTHAGGVRIDHILGLARLWLIPAGATPEHGAYLKYPLHDLLRLIALEAWRHNAIVIGENLGTVPAGFNDHLEQTGVLGTSVLWFERKNDSPDGQAPAFLAAAHWPAHTVATPTTHDLPTVSGWWQERDLDWRCRLGLIAAHETEAALRLERAQSRTQLWHALRAAGCVQEEAVPDCPPITAVLDFISRTPAALCLVPVEDLLGLAEQPNLPGTVKIHPNWMQRLPVAVEDLFQHDAVPARTAALKRAAKDPL